MDTTIAETEIMETAIAETAVAETAAEQGAGLFVAPILSAVFLAAIAALLCVVLYRAVRRRMAVQLYDLEKEFQTLKSYDVYAALFMRNARAIQAMLGIERSYPEDMGMVKRLRTEYVSLLCQKDLTPAGFSVPVPAAGMDRRAFVSRKAAEKPSALKQEIEETRARVSEREDRLAYKKAVEGTGALLYRVAQESGNPDGQPGEIRSCIRKIYALLCASGIYPMYYGDFPENSPYLREFEEGSPYATEYPGLYEKQGKDYRLLQECWGVRKGGGL